MQGHTQATAVYFIRHVQIAKTPYIINSKKTQNIVKTCGYLHIRAS